MKTNYLVIIAGRKQKDALLSELSSAGARLIDNKYGKGTVNAGYIKNTLGLVHEENKTIITCLIAREKIDGVLQTLLVKHKFNQPNTGIAYTIPIDRLSF